MGGVVVLGVLVCLLGKSAFAAEEPCTKQIAIAVSPASLLRHPAEFDGKCVKLRGLLARRGIAPSVPALYGTHRLIATYADNEGFSDALWRRRSFVEIVARATTCETIWANSEAQAEARNRQQTDVVSIAFVSGLCHYQGGAAVIVSALRWLPGNTRLSGEVNRRRFGNLVQISSL